MRAIKRLTVTAIRCGFWLDRKSESVNGHGQTEVIGLDIGETIL